MPQPELPYHSFSASQLEDLMLDANEEQEKLIVIELARRGVVTKTCLKCGEAIGHGLFCKKHYYMTPDSVHKQ